jgi:hypothetical protein
MKAVAREAVSGHVAFRVHRRIAGVTSQAAASRPANIYEELFGVVGRLGVALPGSDALPKPCWRAESPKLWTTVRF